MKCGDLFEVFLLLPSDDRVIVVVSNHYSVFKELFISMGLEEGSDFVDVYILTRTDRKTSDFDDSAIIGRY